MIQLLWETNSGSVISPGQIQYTFITPDITYRPNGFFDNAFQLMREFPRELLQLKNAADFFDFSYKSILRKSINLFMMPDSLFNGPPEKDLRFFSDYSGLFNKDIIKVFLIDKAVQHHEQVSGVIKLLPFAYYVFIGDPGESNALCYDPAKAFLTGNELVKLIENDLASIYTALNESHGVTIEKFEFDINPKANEVNPYYPMMYTKSNYFLINQILANFWLQRPPEPTNAQIQESSHRRIELQIEQINVMDGLHKVIKVKEPVTPIEPYYPAIIIAAPFHFPRYGKLLKAKFKSKLEKMLFRASQAEQRLDYQFTMDGDIVEFLGQEKAGHVLAMVTQRLLALDYLAYLHALFGYSPVLRLPLMGKSLNMDLSHFQQSFPNKRSAIDKIGSIGSLMREKMIADEVAKTLIDRNGQLVFISDLPMEWVKLNEYPVCLTHDVCRIPEFNGNSLINNFIHNQRFEFRIKPDILKRTLIIHCASDDEEDMHAIFELYGNLKAVMGFESVVCKSVAEIDAAVKKHKPDLLIFDCHGDADQKTLSSYLVVDGKNDILLTGDDIIKHSISAPLVFISACSTMPNYGYVKFLSDAFFQAGAFVVTATFMPIKMNEAATLVIRLLSGLKQQEDKLIFSNWLSFVSHHLRSTLIFETIRKERVRNNMPEDIPEKDVANFLLEIMVFDARAQVFENVKKYLQSINPDMNTAFNHLDHEWLSYTTLGRADLVYFESWVAKHRSENLELN